MNSELAEGEIFIKFSLPDHESKGNNIQGQIQGIIPGIRNTAKSDFYCFPEDNCFLKENS